MKRKHMLGLVVFVSIVMLGQGNAVAQQRHYGGRGGTEHGPKECPDYVVGIHGYVGAGGEGGTVVTQLGFSCANGQHELGTFGPPTGTYFEIRCNPGDAANGVGARTGKYLDAIGLWCRDPRGNSYVAPVTAGPFFGMAGGGGGSIAPPLKCGMQGEIPLIGLDIWSGANIDGFDPICNLTIDAMWSGQHQMGTGVWTWNTLGHPEDGDFSIPVRFTREGSQWKMYILSLSVDIGEKYELQKGQMGLGTVNGNQATLTLPLHGFGYIDLPVTLSLSTDKTINPPGVSPQSGQPHNGNRLDLVGLGQFGNNTFWAAFRGTITNWPNP